MNVSNPVLPTDLAEIVAVCVATVIGVSLCYSLDISK